MKTINQNKFSKTVLSVLFTTAALFAQAQTAASTFHSKYEETLVNIKSTASETLFKQNIELATVNPIATEDVYAIESAKKACIRIQVYSDIDKDGVGGAYQGDLPSSLIFLNNCFDSAVIAYYQTRGAVDNGGDCDDGDARIQNVTSAHFFFVTSPATICNGSVFNLNVDRKPSNDRFEFIVNGVRVQIGTDTNFSSNSLPTGINHIECVMTGLTFIPACYASRTASETITVEVNSTARPTVAIVANKTAIQTGDTVIVTATSPNGGVNPIYQFFVSGTLKQGGFSNVFKTNLLHSNDSISCVITTTVACQTIKFNTSNIIVIQADLLPIIGVKEVCEGARIQLRNLTPIPVGGSGFWQTGNQSIAIINLLTGVVTGIHEGAVLITYNVVSGGVTKSISDSIFVGSVPVMQSTFGSNAVCVGSSIQLINNSIVPATGRSFWSSVSGRATVNASTGVVTGTSAGVALITYSIFNRGCNNIVLHYDTVRSQPLVPSIGYAAGTPNPQYGVGGGFCTGKTFTVAGTPSGGGWSKTGVITVTSPAGVVNTGSTPGVGTLTYTFTDAFGCSNSRTIVGNVVACAFRGVGGATNEKQETRNDFTIYPNPASLFISLNVNSLISVGTIVVTDVYGKEVKKQMVNGKLQIVNLQGLNKGIYFVSMITNEGKTTKKLVVE